MPEDPYDIVIRGRAALKARRDELVKWVADERRGKPFSVPSDATLADYRRDVDRLMSEGQPWEAAANTTKVKTWLKRKSALLTIGTLEIEQLLKAQDKLQRLKLEFGTAEFNEWVDVLKKLHTYTAILETRPPRHEPKKPETRVIKNPSKKASKRKIGSLPEDWREQLVARMPVWRLQAMACAVTGCRPSEIGLGVKLTVSQGQLLAKIQGKKTGLYSGQKWRAMAWPLLGASQLVHDLADRVKKAGGEMIVDYSSHRNPNPAKAFSGAMRQAAARAFPGHAVTLTPYSMRHAMASDLKASDLSPQEVSKALGHQAVATQSTYGSRQQGSGSLAPIKVDAATKKVRGEPSVPPAKAEKITRPDKAVVPK